MRLWYFSLIIYSIEDMHPRRHTALLLLAIVLAFLWLKTPILNSYSLQAVAGCTFIYFVIKRKKRSKIHHILPDHDSAEMALVTFGLMILIGSSGTIASPLFPLTYIHLFFLVMSSDRATSVVVGPATALFHFGLEPVISGSNIGHLLAIPIMLMIFLFARQQHEELIKNQSTMHKEEQLIAKYSENAIALEEALQNKNKLIQRNNLITESMHNLLSIVRLQLKSWDKHYFACEPTAHTEMMELEKQVAEQLKQLQENQLVVSRDAS